MTKFASRVGLAGTKKGLTAIDVSGGDHVLGTSDAEGIGLFTVGGGDIHFTDAAGASHTITFPAWAGIDVGVHTVHQAGTTATGIFAGKVV